MPEYPCAEDDFDSVASRLGQTWRCVVSLLRKPLPHTDCTGVKPRCPSSAFLPAAPWPGAATRVTIGLSIGTHGRLAALYKLQVNRQDIEQAVLDSLTRIAPEVDISAIEPDVSFRDQFDFDSMNYLSLILDLDKKLGIHIPELDYPKLSSLSGCVQYLDNMLNGASRTG